MAYQKTVWKDRKVEKIRTFIQKTNTDGTITLTPSEGQILEAGTPIIALSMNNIEDKIKELDDKHLVISATQPMGHTKDRAWIKIIG